MIETQVTKKCTTWLIFFTLKLILSGICIIAYAISTQCKESKTKEIYINILDKNYWIIKIYKKKI